MKDDIFMVLKCTYVQIQFLEQIVVMWNLHKTSIENLKIKKRETSGQYFATFSALTIDRWIHSLWTAHPQKDNHIIRGQIAQNQSKWSFCKTILPHFVEAAIAGDFYFSLLHVFYAGAILLKITLLTVVRSKDILKFKLEVEYSRQEW